MMNFLKKAFKKDTLETESNGAKLPWTCLFSYAKIKRLRRDVQKVW